MSDTPRTDATQKEWKDQIRTASEIWDFARGIERELAAERAKVADYAKELERIRTLAIEFANQETANQLMEDKRTWDAERMKDLSQ